MSEHESTQSQAHRRPGGAMEPEANPLKWIHSVLRGRYHWALVLALVLGVGGAVAGYKSIAMRFKSTGSLRVLPYTAPVLYDGGGSHISVQRLAQSQAELLGSQRVADMAMQSDRWKALRRPATEAARGAFRGAIHVHHGQGSEYIHVSFEHKDPSVTKAGVHAVIEAFQRLLSEQSLDQDTQRLKVLQDRSSSLSAQLNSIEDKRHGLVAGVGPAGVEQVYRAKLIDMGKLESTLEEARLRLAQARQNPGQFAGQYSSGGDNQLSPQARRLNQLRDQRDNLNMRLDQMRMRFGEQHHQVRQLKDQLEVLDKQIAMESSKAPQGAQAAGTDTGSDAASGIVARFQDRVDALQAQHKQIQKEVADLAVRSQKLSDLDRQESTLRDQLHQTKQRIEQINLESSVNDRTQVASYNDAPTPANRVQKLQFGLLGGLGGAALGVGLILLMGMVRPQFRHVGEVPLHSHGAAVLGMLPLLPEQDGSPEDAMRAGQCLHHIRTRLQLDHIDQGRRVIMVTGPESGTGKTSVSLSLGVSFATAGSRTLLIDFDMIAGRLSRRLGAKRHQRLGYLLRQRGLVDEPRLQALVNDPGVNGQRLGEALRERGVVTPEALEDALASQTHSAVGVIDALAGEPLDHCIQPTAIPGLEILPLGDAKEQDAPRLNTRSTKELMDKLRARYDVVLIDSGPAPGSVETPIIAAAVDAAMLVVSRGERRGGLHQCAGFFQGIGVRLAGVVFNRARGQDLAHSPYSRSHSVRGQGWEKDEPGSARNGKAGANGQNGHSGQDYGSVVDAVLKSTR